MRSDFCCLFETVISFSWNSFTLKLKPLFWNKASLLGFFCSASANSFEFLSGAGLEPVALLLLNHWASHLSWFPLLCWRPVESHSLFQLFSVNPHQQNLVEYPKEGWLFKVRLFWYINTLHKEVYPLYFKQVNFFISNADIRSKI